MVDSPDLDTEVDDDGVSTDRLTDFAYVIPLEKFVYRLGDTWSISTPVGKEGIVNHLIEDGWPTAQAVKTVKFREYLRVYGAEIAPNKPKIFENAQGRMMLNTWVPPTIQPRPGEYPRLQRVIDWLTCGDKQAEKWIKHWMAWKVQNPELVPKIAPVFITKPGGGKGTLASVMMAMLGRSNCAAIKRAELENKFNGRWAGKLFVLADEILSNENLKSVSEVLKILVDSNDIEFESKGKDQRTITNRLAWMFASNDSISPVVLEEGDRRYSVFANTNDVPPEHEMMFKSMFDQNDTRTPTDGFMVEIEAYYAELLETQVDRWFVSRPYQNDARQQLIEANRPAHELFCRYVDEHGVDEFLDAYAKYPPADMPNRTEWDFGAEGVATAVLYRAYADFCKRFGARALRVNKFGVAINAHRPAWPSVRNTSPSGKRVYCYVVPRGQPAAPKLAAVPGATAT